MGDGSQQWLSELQGLPEDRVFVQHEPPTPRYGRAQAKLCYVVRKSYCLGSRESPEHGEGAMDIALWCPPPQGRGYGYYTCFRIFQSEDEVVAAVLFCFYDGTEKSPGFKSRSAAQAFAESRGFRCEHHEDD